MRCRRCRRAAVVELRRHNAAFCADCFLRHVREQVKRAIEEHDMFEPLGPDPGRGLGRQGLARAVGRPARARLPGRRAVPRPGDRRVLGALARTRVRVRARTRRATSSTSTSRATTASTCRPPGKKGSRSTCAVCGLSKRYVFNRAAREGGYDVIATGHNLDDEAATLLGNTLRWQTRLHRAPVARCCRRRTGSRARSSRCTGLRSSRPRAYAFLRRDRLRRGGVPARGRQHAAPLQGRDEPASNRPRPGPRPSSSSAT